MEEQVAAGRAKLEPKQDSVLTQEAMSQSKKGISKIGVVGAGNMGSGIAQNIAQGGINVVMLDVKEEFVSRGLSNIKKILEEGIERKLFTPAKVQEILSRITATTDLNALSDADIVIEAVFENKEVKSELFGKLDKICSPETILATNTSSFFVKEFAEKTSRPAERRHSASNSR